MSYSTYHESYLNVPFQCIVTIGPTLIWSIFLTPAVYKVMLIHPYAELTAALNDPSDECYPFYLIMTVTHY